MLDLAGARHLVTRRQRLDTLGAVTAGLLHVLLLGAAAAPQSAAGGPSVSTMAEIAGGPDEGSAGENLPPRSEPGDPAYVIFTSASTGPPNGGQLFHGPLLNPLHCA